MAVTKKASTRKARSTSRKARPASLTDSARKRIEKNEQVIRRVSKSLDNALADLGKIGGSVGNDLSKRVRDARRDATKLGNSARKDLERLRKDMAAAKSNAGRGGKKGSRTGTGARKSRAATSTRSSRATGAAARKTRAGGTAKKTPKASRSTAGKSRSAKASR